jgi:hypothetical protein
VRLLSTAITVYQWRFFGDCFLPSYSTFSVRSWPISCDTVHVKLDIRRTTEPKKLNTVFLSHFTVCSVLLSLNHKIYHWNWCTFLSLKNRWKVLM